MTQRLFRRDSTVMGDLRQITMKALAERLKEAPPDWYTCLSPSSLLMISPDRNRIIKIDSSRIYTLDVKKPDGSYRSTRFTCKTVDEAWGMASQILKVYNAVH